MFVFLDMIKFAHTIFAMPFALTAYALAVAAVTNPGWLRFFLVIAALVAARTMAMAFNRFVDAGLDAENPRTAERAIPAGKLSRTFALVVTIVFAAAFVALTYFMNNLAFALSPVVLVVLLGYSFTKRFTSLTHFGLGLALGLAPLGAHIAVTGAFSGKIAAATAVLGFAVMLWTAGFDIIYSCQDYDFDVAKRLRSIPAKFGIRQALLMSQALHAAMIVALLGVLFLAWPHLRYTFCFGIVGTAVMLIYEHSLVKPYDLSRVNTAFFTMNGCVSVFLFITALVDLFLVK
ncbi:MAG: 4-hydroxybenzoate octaprenyltransferase [Planctomycetota bacterium]|nr:MAG: 4-hydroxybenzoate octaprenyltransferase [Planctomycetota bacterium]